MSFGSQQRHSVVLEVGVKPAFMRLTELSQQTSIARSSVQAISLDPKDSTRLAFHLASGWSGIGSSSLPTCMSWSCPVVTMPTCCYALLLLCPVVATP